jgi:dolichyl-phosphate beta-glucosyltransferase
VKAATVSPDSLSIVVPAFNEALRIDSLLAALEQRADAASARAGLRLNEVLLVDDGSTDATAARIEAFTGLRGRLRLIQLPRNEGKGAAVRTGMLAARGEVALMSDADLSTPLEDLPLLAAALAAGADVAIGSRALPDSRVLVHQPPYRELMGKAFNVALRLLTGLPYRDTQCGFKLFRLRTARALFELQRVRGFAFDAELCVLARELGLRVAEIPVRWRNNRQTRVTLFGSSLRMALDLVSIARLARAPRRARDEVGSPEGGGRASAT